MGSKANLLTKTSSASATNYYYSQTISHNGTNYVLGSDATQYILESNYSKLPGYYTCLSTSNTCEKAYYVVDATSTEIYSLALSSGRNLDSSNKMIISSTFEDNGDGTYTLTNPITINKTDWYNDYEKYDGYYTCNGYNITTCTTSKWLMYIDDPTNTSFNFSYSKLNYLYGNSFTYDGTNYTLKDTKKFWNWDLNYNTLDNHHYTCFNDTGVCENVYYISYFGSADSVRYLTLKNGKNIEKAKEEMFANTNDSTIKSAIDNWYKANMTTYTESLEDTVWCNDRTLIDGTLLSKDASSSISLFGASGRNISTFKPSVSCTNIRDSFTVSDENGNGKLTYPVGLLTSDEYTLAGSGSKGNSTTAYLRTGQNQWTLSPHSFNDKASRVFRLHSSVINSGINANAEIGVRPSVSLKPGTYVYAGDGTANNPYIVE